MELASSQPEPVTRLRAFLAAWPDVEIRSPLENQSAFWRARRAGLLIATEHDLGCFMDKLESLAAAGWVTVAAS